MTSTRISEFTFGFAFLHEQANINAGHLISAPILPSLLQEEEAAFDAMLPTIGGAQFYQFKISEYLVRTNARFMKGKPYYSPYYCISLHRNKRNQQHNRLKNLSIIHPHTYYVAPEFDGLEAFNSAFIAGTVSENSRAIPLRDCIFINDDKQHYISYQSSPRSWSQHSEIKTHESAIAGSELKNILMNQKDLRPIDLNFALELYHNITAPLLNNGLELERLRLSGHDKEFLHLAYQNKSLRTILLHTAKVASVFYGATLVISGSKKKRKES